MADKMRWRYGDTKPVVSKAVGTAVVIEIGDIVIQVAGEVLPASGTTWNTSLAQTQEDFAPTFLGVAMQRSRAGDVAPIRVATAGVFEFDTASATYELGALVGPAKATGNALENQKVAAVAAEYLGIGRVAKRGASVTAMLVEIVSAILHGGPQEPISSGA